jgi:hypothetical protein
MQVLRIASISALMLLIYGCSHPIEIVGEGDVWSTGGRSCTLEDYEAGKDNCTKNYVGGAYQETYHAEARTGWEFERWEQYCTDAPDHRCSFDVAAGDVQKAWGKTVPPLVAKFSPIENSNFFAPPSDCLWVGPYVKESPAFNFAFPDSGAIYWSAAYRLPEEGSYITLEADFPYSRYMSFNSYRGDATPAQSLTDRDIVPELNSVNPFIDGGSRIDPARRYVVSVLPGEPLATPLTNTLHDATAQAGDEAVLVYRNYVPNDGTNRSGDVGLPRVTLHLADGSTLQGEDACGALQAATEPVEIPFVPAAIYDLHRENYEPAKNPPKFRATYGIAYMFQCDYQGDCTNNPERNTAFYANADNQYLYSFLNREFAEVAVIRGRIPQIPRTLNGEETFNAGELRYWSLCQNEFFSQKVKECLYDEQVTINPDGFYTIVTSTDGDRPSNATDQCGVGYLPWSDDGDGFSLAEGYASDPNSSFLVLRHMLPADDFEQTIENTETAGDEAAILGEFLPKATYMSRTEFESLGCDPYLALPYEDM